MSYVFQAYPMRVTAPDGQRVRVFSQQEHDELLASWNPAVDPSPVAPVVEAPVVVPAKTTAIGTTAANPIPPVSAEADAPPVEAPAA